MEKIIVDDTKISVLKFDDLHDRTVHVESQPVLEIACRYHVLYLIFACVISYMIYYKGVFVKEKINRETGNRRTFFAFP